MLIINPIKPLYINKKNKLIRMGNFKDTGKEIQFEDESLISLFNTAKEPISKNELIDVVNKNTKIPKEEIAKAVDYLLDEKFLIDFDKYTKLLKNEKLSRQNLFFSMCSDEIYDWDIKKQPNILILGLGGIGSNVSLILSRSGFNNFTMVDCDKVEESNLIRQLPYTEKDIGKNKTHALVKKIKNNNGNSNIKIYNKKIIKEEDIESIIFNSDFVICTLDKPARVIRRIINKVCVKYSKPVLFSGFAEHVAMIGPFIVPGKSACLNCIEKKRIEKPFENVKITPSYGPLCALISSIVSNEVINYFHNFNDNHLIGKTLMINILNYKQHIIKWQKSEKCEVCRNASK